MRIFVRMMETPESLPIVYDPVTGNFSCRLPAAICNDLLLSYEPEKGISVCHQQKEKLEDLVIKIDALHQEAQILKNKTRQARLSKAVPAVIVLLALMASVFFTESLFKNKPSLRLPLSLVGAIIAMYCCYTLFTNYSFAGSYDKGADTLRHRLALADLQKQIKQGFTS